MAIYIVNKRNHIPTAQDVFIGRGSVLGNIYSHLPKSKATYKVHTLDEACDSYYSYLEDRIKARDPEIIKELNRIYSMAISGDIYLVCYCAPDRCHGSSIKNRVEAKIEQRKQVMLSSEHGQPIYSDTSYNHSTSNSI